MTRMVMVSSILITTFASATNEMSNHPSNSKSPKNTQNIKQELFTIFVVAMKLDTSQQSEEPSSSNSSSNSNADNGM